VDCVGSLIIPAHSHIICDALTSVGSYLRINADAKLDALTSVGGDLYINADAKLDALTSVGNDLYIDADAKLDAPNLASVKGKPYKAVRP
jgi:UDP-3-O-[3-hydroxymyristoyl] glucosamine N-acyltransferase